MDKIFIKNLTAHTTIGIHAWEKQIKQKVIIDLAFEVDTTQAATTDDISHTIDYAAISEATQTFLANHPHQLIEAAANTLANYLTKEFNLSSLSLTLTKPGALKQGAAVGITLQR